MAAPAPEVPLLRHVYPSLVTGGAVGQSSVARVLAGLASSSHTVPMVAPGQEMSTYRVPGTTNRGGAAAAHAQAIIADRVHALAADVRNSRVTTPAVSNNPAIIETDRLPCANVLVATSELVGQERELYLVAALTQLGCNTERHVSGSERTSPAMFSRSTMGSMGTFLACLFSDPMTVLREISHVHGFKLIGVRPCSVPSTAVDETYAETESFAEVVKQTIALATRTGTKEGERIRDFIRIVISANCKATVSCSDFLEDEDMEACFTGRIDASGVPLPTSNDTLIPSAGVPMMDLTDPVEPGVATGAPPSMTGGSASGADETGEAAQDLLGGGSSSQTPPPTAQPQVPASLAMLRSEIDDDLVESLYMRFLEQQEEAEDGQLKLTVLAPHFRLYLACRLFIYTGVDPKSVGFGWLKGIVMATKKRLSSAQVACMASGVMLTGVAKQPSGRGGQAEGYFRRYVIKRTRNAAEMLRHGAVPIGLPFRLPVSFQSAIAMTGMLQFSYGIQNRIFRYHQGLLTCGDTRLASFGERTIELLRFSQRTQLREVIDVAIARVPSILELPAAKVGLEALERALSAHLSFHDISLFGLSGFLGLHGCRSTEARELGALAVGTMSFVTPRDVRWQDFSPIEVECDQADAEQVRTLLELTIGSQAITPKVVGRTIFRGTMPAIMDAPAEVTTEAQEQQPPADDSADAAGLLG